MIRVVIGIIRKNNKILVCERPVDKPYAGYWEFPGGKIEAHESDHDALRRELHEELGIEVQDASFWFEHTHRYPDKEVHLHIWIVNSFQREPENKEGQALRWVNYAELIALKLLEGNLTILDKIKTLWHSD